MPVRGLTDNPRMPRQGYIRLGVKKTNARGVEYPTATEHFVVPEEVEAVYGPEPTELDILFPVDNIELIASTYYRAYSQTRGLTCKGDGVTARRLIDSAQKTTIEMLLPREVGPGHVECEPTSVPTGPIARHDAKEVEWVDPIPCPGDECPYYQKKDCKVMMALQFILPKVPGLGIYTLNTGSFNSIKNIDATIKMIKASLRGRVSMVPLTLTLEPIEVQADGKKKTVRVLNLRSHSTWHELALISRENPLELPAGEVPEVDDDETPDDLYPTEEAVAARAEAETPTKPPVEPPAPPAPPEPAANPRLNGDTETTSETGEEKRARMIAYYKAEFIKYTDALGFVNAPRSKDYEKGKSRADLLNDLYGKGWDALSFEQMEEASDKARELAAKAQEVEPEPMTEAEEALNGTVKAMLGDDEMTVTDSDKHKKE